jgi:hypothetical protein
MELALHRLLRCILVAASFHTSASCSGPLNTSGSDLCGCEPDGTPIIFLCAGGGNVTGVVFASIGTPGGTCNAFARGGCDGNPAAALAAVTAACVGKPGCTLPTDIQFFNGGVDPCYGTAKSCAVQVTCSTPQPPPPPPPPPPSFCNGAGFSLEWSDEFEGSAIDETTWSVIEGSSPHPNVDDCYGDQCPPWAGCRAGYCLSRNVQVENGTAVLRSDNSGHLNYSFTTATIVTRGKKAWSWLDGAYRMCISARLPGTEGANNNGLWPAHWLLPDDPALCDPDAGEIDVMEMVNGNGALYTDYWWQDPSWPHSPTLCNNSSAERFVRAIKGVPTWHSAFHEYAYEAGPTWLAMAIDGEVLANWTHASKGALFVSQDPLL